MALIENINRVGVDAGRFTPRANQKQFCSSWGVVEGNASSGWVGVNEHLSGIARGQGREKLLPYTEFKDKDGKFHEIHFGNMKLREMICNREDADAATKFEGYQSSSRVAVEAQIKQHKDIGDGLIRNDLENSHEYFECIGKEEQSYDTEPKRGGRPKGSKNRPKISAETSAE